MRYISTTLAAYVGETVAIRYDPRDMAEIRVFHQDRFLCQAVCPELAGSPVSLREIIRARNHRRRELRETVRERQAAVNTLIQLKQGQLTEVENEQPQQPRAAKPAAPRLKRYRNE